MPVLELTQLCVKGGMSAEENTTALLETLSTVRGKLQTTSRFYACSEDPTLLYILGLWPSLDAHSDFLASPAREQILGPQEHIFDFKWSVHMELDAMSSLPFDSPVLAIARLAVPAQVVDEYEQAVIKDRQTLLQGIHHAQKVVHGWRCDAPPGSHEALLFIGWADTQAHNDFMVAIRDNGRVGARPAIVGKYENLQVHTAWDLERKR